MNKGKVIPLLLILSIVFIAGCASSNNKQENSSNTVSTSCKSDWKCTDWSTCTRTNATIGVQNRVCTDVINCSSALGKPQESQICELPLTTSKEPNELALQLSDFSSTQNNWTLKERVERTRNDVGTYAKEIGWQKGYRITYYTGQAPNIGYIEQGVSFYPRESVSLLLDTNNTNSQHYLFYNSTKNNAYFVFDDLSSPNAGERSIGYRITKYTGLDAGTYYYIEFYKLNVYEYINMWGQTLDYELMKDLARKAADKIV